MRNQNYLPRIIDKVLESHLKTFGAACIEAVKWYGKTWTPNIYSNSSIYIGDPIEISQTSLWKDLTPNWYWKGIRQG